VSGFIKKNNRGRDYSDIYLVVVPFFIHCYNIIHKGSRIPFPSQQPAVNNSSLILRITTKYFVNIPRNTFIYYLGALFVKKKKKEKKNFFINMTGVIRVNFRSFISRVSLPGYATGFNISIKFYGSNSVIIGREK
jgi:hypothetical protein